MEELSDSLQVNLSSTTNEDKDAGGSDEFWKEDDSRRDSWVDTGPLSDELRLLDEEQKRQIEEARQWFEEEEAADEMLRRDLEELQLAEQRNHELSARLIAPEPEIPPEAQEKLDLLEKTVKSLQEQLNEKSSKLSERNECYSELLMKFNNMTDRVLTSDHEFKQTLARVKEEYEELEGVLKGKMKTYQDLNKHLELALNKKEAEIADWKDKLSDYDTMKNSFSALQNKLDDATKSVHDLNKMTVKLKERLKTIRSERDSLLKERESAEPVEPLKLKISELEAERNELLEERKKFEDVELLKNRITLLEEEKGNLQLQLVDLDELKELAESNKLFYDNLEKENKELKNTLESIQEQNADLINGKESAKKISDEQEAVIVKLKNALQEVTEEKIGSVMRSVELEEMLVAKEKDIFNLKNSLRIIEAENVEKSKQAGERAEGDSELLSDYNVSNGLQVKLTVLQDEVENCKERERALSVTVSELQNLRMELESKLHAALADREKMRTELESKGSANIEPVVSEMKSDFSIKLAEMSAQKAELEAKLTSVLENLEEQGRTCTELQGKLSDALSRNETLSKALSEKETISKDTASTSTVGSGPAEPDVTTQKLKKLAAMYKKRCGEMENEIEQLKANLNKRSDDCSMLASERSCLEHDVLNQASRYQQIFNEAKRLEIELTELYSFINEFRNVPLESVASVVDPSKVREVLASLAAWSSRTGIHLPPSVYKAPTILALNAADIDELQKILSEKEETIQELEKDKNHLCDVIAGHDEELKLLREMYEKEAGKNEQFFTDLMGLETEMSQSKSELVTRLEEVTSDLQARENYIEILEQDILNMKTKMFSIESGMDDRHRELKDRAQMMISKLEEAELMSETRNKYQAEVEKKIKVLEESEAQLKDQLINVQVQLEEAQEEASAAKLRNSMLEKEKENSKLNIDEMLSELQTLRDIRNAYNNTLDEIEQLNGGLKEAMEGFEAKSEKLILLESEREALINKLTDLEDAFGDLERKLEDSESMNLTCRSQIEMLTRQLEESKTRLQEEEQKLSDMRKNQAGTEYILEKELNELGKSYDEKVNVLVSSKDKLEQLLFSKSNEVSLLQNSLKQLEEELIGVRQGYESRMNEMESSSQQQLQSVMSELDNLRKIHHSMGAGAQVETYVQGSQTSPLHSEVKRLASGDSMENPFADIKDEEDGWGWMGAENVMPVEGESSQQLDSSRIAELQSSLQQMQSERDRALEELEAVKLNYKKVVKKLRDVKAEKTKAETKGGFSDLDLVLQEELRSENDVLQGKMGELVKQVDSLKTEKDMLTKRVDTLTSANEQLVDMKERQDIEVQIWHKRSADLSNQVQNLQWSLEEMKSHSSDPELSMKMNALFAENEDLKSVLNVKKDEINRALAREQDLEQEILDLKENLMKMEKSPVGIEKPEAKSDVAPIASAAVLFQGTAAAFDDVFSSWGTSEPAEQSVEDNSSTSVEELQKQKSELQLEISRLTKEIEALGNDKTHLAQKVKSLFEENAQLLKRIEEVISNPDEEQARKVQMLEKQVGSQKAYFDEQVKELEQNFQKALLERDEDNAHLVCTVSAKDQALNNASQELQSIREQYKNVSELQAKLLEYQKENGILRSEMEGLRNYIDVSRESSENEHSNVIESLRNQISVLEETNAGITRILNGKEVEVEMLSNTLREKEKELLACQEKIQYYSREIDELKCNSEEDAVNSGNVLAEINRMSSVVADLEVTIKNQKEQLSDKDRIIFELQNEIRCIESVTDTTEQYPSPEEEDRLRYTIGFLEQERLRLEELVQEKLSEVAKYESEIQELKTAQNRPSPEDVSTYIALIEEKDGEINRLAKAVVEIQERLLLSEQGKLNPDLRVVQAKLDQALYTLHARDVKIEELTMEIIQLLGERDSLQFRLSDALRRGTEPSKADLQASPIHEKLSELHAGYKKDPLVQTDREARHIQTMELYSESPSVNKDENVVDYGIFNWFFGGPSSPPSQVGINEGS